MNKLNMMNIRTEVKNVAIPIYIYALCEPGTNDYRYVGRTKNVKSRLGAHLSEAKVVFSFLYGRRCKWLNSLIVKGLKPDLVILEETNSDIAHLREYYWITKLKEDGFNLTNDSIPNPNYKPKNIEFRNGKGTYW
jgi:hypothetical protein